MPSKQVLVFLVAVVLAVGCAHKASMSVDRAGTDMVLGEISASPRALMRDEMPIGDFKPQRFIAVRHQIAVLSTEADLPKSWESIVKYCATIQCEVTSSNLTARTRDLSASGTITMRIAPQDFPKMFLQAEKQGNIVQHTTQTEDKTSNVVDTEAKLKNLGAYRDRLRTMLSKPSVSVKDLIEIQEKLSEVQSQLDSESATRKILANETEKVSVEIAFLVERPSHSRSGFAPIWDAIRDSGSNLGESLATLIMVVVAVIPWLLVLVPTIWLLARLWRKFRAKRTQPSAASAS